MGLAVLVSGHELLALLVMFGCVFFALYLVRISQTLLAFWITAVLALLYGLIGQFSVQTLVLRIEETAVGAAMGMLAAYLVVPKRTREAFGEALTTWWTRPMRCWPPRLTASSGGSRPARRAS
jgi:uncharacterized membrane protein YccC